MKKKVNVIIIILTLVSVTAGAQIMGDVNGDSTLNIIDTLLIAKSYVAANTATLEASIADVNCNGTIDIVDALVIAKAYVEGTEISPCQEASGGGKPDFSLVGYATMNGGTKGGAGGPSVTVSTGIELQEAIKQGGPRIIYVNGTITPGNSKGSKIETKKYNNISIIGVGTKGEFKGIGIKITKSSNIIIRNLKIHHVRSGDKDCISIEGPANNIWIDHCELYNDVNSGKDYYDGLLDAKKKSQYLTYSWNIFHDSYKAVLVGSSDGDKTDRKVTLHHNWFYKCNSRVPLYRFGKGHIYNCLYSNIISTGVNSRMGAVIRIENTIFENCKDPIGSWYSKQTGSWDIKNVIYKNCTGSQPSSSNGSFKPPYSYKLDNVDQVKSLVQSYAGVGKI